jgi:peptidase C39-like protein
MTARRTGIKVTKQRHDFDCGVASLAMLVGRPYGDIAAIVRDVVDPKKLRRRGMAIYDMQLVASHFGVALAVIHRKKDYLIGRTGIIGLIGGLMDKAGHWAVLKDGAVIADPDDASIWSVDDYLKRHNCRTTVLLVSE